MWWLFLLGVAVLLGDTVWVYRLGLANAFSDFGTAIAIVILAIIGALLLYASLTKK